MLKQNRPAITFSSGRPVTVPGEKVEIKSSTTELGVSVALPNIPVSPQLWMKVRTVTWAHLMKPLQLSGSGYRPSLTEQSTLLLPSHPVVVGGGDVAGDVGGDVGPGGGDVHGPSLLVLVSM